MRGLATVVAWRLMGLKAGEAWGLPFRQRLQARLPGTSREHQPWPGEGEGPRYTGSQPPAKQSGLARGWELEVASGSYPLASPGQPDRGLLNALPEK